MLPEWLEKLKGIHWLDILKALPFEGGPSSAKWVYLALNAVLSTLALLLTLTLCAGALLHRLDAAMAGVLCGGIVSIAGVLQICATNALNYRRKVTAQVATNDKPIGDAPALVSTAPSGGTPCPQP